MCAISPRCCGRPLVALQLLAERLVVCFGHAEQVGDDEQRERVRVLVHELALTPGDELVDLAIGEPPHELLVLLEALRRDQPHQQPAVRGVLRRIERGQLIAERQAVAVLLDDVADVVALERHRPLGPRSGDRVADENVAVSL